MELCVMLCYAVLCCAVLCYAMLCCAVLCYAVLCCAVLCPCACGEEALWNCIICSQRLKFTHLYLHNHCGRLHTNAKHCMHCCTGWVPRSSCHSVCQSAAFLHQS